MRPTIADRLSAWRNVFENEEPSPTRPVATVAQLVVYGKVLLWLAGVSACLLLAWAWSGESILLTGVTMLFPLIAWGIFRLWSWGLLLPVSLIGLLALQGAVLLS